MKKILLSSAMVAVLGVVAAPSAFAASGGTITINGEVLDGTCTVSGGENTSGGADFTVDLAPVHKDRLPAANSVAGAKGFTVNVGGNAGDVCDTSKLAKLWFQYDATKIDSATGNLKNIDATGPAMVQVQLLNQASTAINLYTGANTSTAPFVSGQAKLQYSAQYFATAAAQPGKVKAQATYVLSYQ
ncbi:fimbrial protein [Lysobacter sp. FW306-1B-D06B]|uniref:fimbrial protein n=1 Tax=Lysobacter sp. FW306-1B-D06B TaxID=3140250 RepID=UPI0031406E69